MNVTIAPYILAFGLATSPLAAAQTSSPHAHHPAAASVTAEADVPAAANAAVAVVARFGEALARADFNTLNTLLDESVLILESGGAERSRAEYLGHHAISDAAFLKAAHVQVKRRTARAEGPLVWVATESELHATKDGKPLTVLSTETMVLRKAGQDWRIVHIHWSSRPKKSAVSPAAPASQPKK